MIWIVNPVIFLVMTFVKLVDALFKALTSKRGDEPPLNL